MHRCIVMRDRLVVIEECYMVQADGLSCLLELIDQPPAETFEDSELAALHATVALRRLCDRQVMADAFCRAKGLPIVAKRLKLNSPLDRAHLRLPMPLGPSTVRIECKLLLGESAADSSLDFGIWGLAMRRGTLLSAYKSMSAALAS